MLITRLGRPRLELTGKKFGRLTVIKFAEIQESGKCLHSLWLCRCRCGIIKKIRGSHLKRSTKSCGCIRRERMACLTYIHGQSRTQEYRAHKALIKRCTSKKYHAYRHYGGRGIKVCRQWLGPSGYKNFLRHMGVAPSKKHSVDRYPNKNGHYEPGNVRWATRKQQANNRRDNKGAR